MNYNLSGQLQKEKVKKKWRKKREFLSRHTKRHPYYIPKIPTYYIFPKSLNKEKNEKKERARHAVQVNDVSPPPPENQEIAFASKEKRKKKKKKKGH